MALLSAGRAIRRHDASVRNTDRRGLFVLAMIVVFAILVGAVLMWINRQPTVTPAASTGSMQEQLSPQTNPKH